MKCRPFFAIVLAALHESACSAPQAQRPLLAPAPDSPIAVAGAPASVVIGEVNGDAKPDLVVASARGAAGDVNRDGKTDVVTSNLEGNSVAVLLTQ